MGIRGAFQVSLVVKNPPANAEASRGEGLIPGWEDTLEEEMASHSSILAWKTPGQRGLADDSPCDRKRVRHD